MPAPAYRHLPRCLLFALLATGGAAQAAAFNDPPPTGARDGAEMRASLRRPDTGRRGVQDSMSDSVRRIERSTRGRVLSVERMHSEGRDLNRVKVMDDSGRVRVYVDDPNSRNRPVRARGNDD